MYFPNYRLRKKCLDKCLKKSGLKKPFHKQHGKQSKHC